ncbi:MAG: translation initiation factor eIF-1A [Candidatus Aenigmatarchaeota archaeon]
MAFKRPRPTPEEEIARTRIPKEGEVLGIVIEMLGASRIRVECSDGFTRICRIPGRMRRRLWVRMGDLVMVKPWKVQSNERADIEWKYTRTQAQWLKKKGYLKNIEYG